MPESREDSNSNLVVLLTSSVAAAVAGLAAAAARSSSSSIPSKRGLLEVLDGEHLRVVARVQRLREGHLALAARGRSPAQLLLNMEQLNKLKN